MENELEDLVPCLQPLLRRQILVTYGEQDALTPGSSRLGGWPDVPTDFRWPRCSLGHYLHFVFQLNLADVAQMQNLLPAQGVLQFFLGGHGERAYLTGHIQYWPASDLPIQGFKPHPAPQTEDFCWGFWGSPKDPWYHKLSPSPLMTETAYRALFRPALSLPPEESLLIPSYAGQTFDELLDGREEMYWELQEALKQPFNDRHRASSPEYAHLLLGYADQGGRGGDPHEMEIPATRQKPPQGECLFTLLPQLSGPVTGWLSAIDTAFDFFMDRQDLQNANFNRVYVSRTG